MRIKGTSAKTFVFSLTGQNSIYGVMSKVGNTEIWHGVPSVNRPVVSPFELTPGRYVVSVRLIGNYPVMTHSYVMSVPEVDDHESPIALDSIVPQRRSSLWPWSR